MRHALRWRLILGGMVAAVMLLSTAAPAMAAGADMFWGIRDDGWIDSYDPVANSYTPIIDVVPPVADTSSSGPNGLAFDETTNRLYFTEYPDAAYTGHPLDGMADLWFVDLDDAVPTETFAGKVPGQVACADIYGGDYYYIGSAPPGTDDLYKVELNADGTITAGGWVKWDISADAHGWTFNGDIAIWEGTIYGWGACKSHGYEFFSVLTDGTAFTPIAKPAGGYALQLAFASDGTLYGHKYQDGMTYEVTWTTNTVLATHVATTVRRYTDTASGSTGTDVGYSLTGSKWYDRDKDSVWDSPGEPGLADWKICLFQSVVNPASGLPEWVPVTDTLTGADGSYSFSGLEAGTYKVAEGVDANPGTCWTQTFPASTAHEVTIAEANVADLNFGNVCLNTSAGGFTLGYWSNKNGTATLAAYNIAEGEVGAWQKFLDEFNLVDKVGGEYDPTIDGAFRAWLLKADATNMSYMLSVQMACTRLNIEVMGADYVGMGVIDRDGSWISVADLLVKANAFLGIDGNEVTLAGDTERPEAEFYKNVFDALNNNRQELIPYDPCPVPIW